MIEPEALFDVTPFMAQQPIVPYDRETVIDTAFHHYREHGFPAMRLPAHVALQQINDLAKTDPDALVHTNTAYHVPDGYQQHRFATEVDGKRTALHQFHRDDYLRHALGLICDGGSRITDTMVVSACGMVRNAQLPAQFRPGFALHLIRKYAPPGAVVFDPSTGYGGRLVGWFASDCAGYIGVDPEPRTSAGNRQMAADLAQPDRTVSLIESPAEDVDPRVVAGRADFALSSPPYFAKERYGDGPGQSWVRYSTPDTWRRGFLEPYLRLTAAALVPGGKAAINVADVRVGKHDVPLVAWTRQAGEDAGLTYLHTDLFPMSRVPTVADRVQLPKYERVIVFEKVTP